MRIGALLLWLLVGCGAIPVGDPIKSSSQAIPGPPGVSCWDLNENGGRDVNEDLNFDGRVDVWDCQGSAGPQGLQGPEGPRGPQGPQGIDAESTMLWWGRINGVAGDLFHLHVSGEGGQLELISLTHPSTGVYRLVFNVESLDIGIVTVLVSGDRIRRSAGPPTVTHLGATQDFLAHNLTIDIVAVSSITPPNDILLVETDANIQIVILH